LSQSETREAFEYLYNSFYDPSSQTTTIPERLITFPSVSTPRGRRPLSLEIDLANREMYLVGLYWKEEIERELSLYQTEDVESCCCGCLELLILDIATFKLLSKPSDGDRLEEIKIFELNSLIHC